MRHPMLSIMSAHIRTLKELTDAGIPRSTIASRCRSGRYQRLLPTVYSLAEPDMYDRCAAVSAWRSAAVLSHRTAAGSTGGCPNRPSSKRRSDEFRDLTSPTAVGMGRPRRSDSCDTLPPRASEPERVLGRELSLRGFALAPNLPIGPYVGDFVDERARIVVEVDGREFHSEPDVFRGDRRRQNWLVREGWMVLRFAAYDVLAHPDAIADEIIAAVRRRRRSRRRK